MKKLLTLFTVLTLCIALCACNTSGGAELSDSDSTVSKSSVADSSDEVSSSDNSSEITTSTAGSSSLPSTTSSDTNTSSTPDIDSKPSYIVPTVSIPSSSEPVDTTPENTTNEFVSNSNSYISHGDLAIRPKHVYWDGNTLVAECFIVNGLSRAVYNINVTNITFSNSAGQIASAAFGVCNGLTLQPNYNAVWTFRFGSDCISSMGADLTVLECDASATYNY